MLDAVKEALGKTFAKADFASAKVSEVGKSLGQAIAEVLATVKAVSATMVTVKSLAERALALAEETQRLLQELHAPCVENTTLLHDCKLILQKNRDEFYPGLQQQVLDLQRKVDALVDIVKALDQKVPPPER